MSNEVTTEDVERLAKKCALDALEQGADEVSAPLPGDYESLCELLGKDGCDFIKTNTLERFEETYRDTLRTVLGGRQ